MLTIIAVVISIVFAVTVIKKLDDIDTHLKELLAARPITAIVPDELGLPALPATIDHRLKRWPEGYAYTSFCLSVAAAVLHEMGAEEPAESGVADDPKFWDSFRENVAENPANAIAFFDMVVGQRLDLSAEGRQLALEPLEAVHRHKTGALIRAAVALGALAGGADTARLAALDRYADRIGLAFQVHDDVLDVIGDTTVLGKRAGADQDLEKSTYPALLGLEAAQQLARDLTDEALAALEPLGADADPLRELARFLLARDH